jgi:acetyl/propionyl-CoA carboxylase alpha subunit
VPPFYDFLLAKVIVHAPSRTDAIEKMAAALSDFSLGGIDTTIAFSPLSDPTARLRDGGNKYSLG